ncbi:hypothetical protein M9458_008044, partial [Cirrhinus mrigala]
FVLIKQNLSWSEALTYCRQNHVDLVSVPSPQIEQRASTAAVWMGLHHSCGVNTWSAIRTGPRGTAPDRTTAASRESEPAGSAFLRRSGSTSSAPTLGL